MQKTILITGGSGLIGSELVKNFAEKNWQVIITTRNIANIDKIKKQLSGENISNINSIEVDFLEDNYISKILEYLEVNKLFPDVLVNNARNTDYLKIEKNGNVLTDNWINEFKMSVIAPYELSFALSQQKDSKVESIINIASMYGVVAANPSLYTEPDNQSPIHYGVCKSAVIHLSKELSIRLSKKKIRVNTVSYGGVEGRADDEFKKRYSQLCPAGKMLSKSELGGIIEFLAGKDLSSGITGQNIIVDGGWSVW